MYADESTWSKNSSSLAYDGSSSYSIFDVVLQHSSSISYSEALQEPWSTIDDDLELDIAVFLEILAFLSAGRQKCIGFYNN